MPKEGGISIMGKSEKKKETGMGIYGLTEICEKCKTELREDNYFYEDEFDVHRYERAVGYECPSCGHIVRF